MTENAGNNDIEYISKNNNNSNLVTVEYRHGDVVLAEGEQYQRIWQVSCVGC